MVNFQDPNVVASEICTNAFHNIIPGLKNTLFYSGGPESLALPRRFIYVRLPPPLPDVSPLPTVNPSLIAGSSSPLLIMSGVSYEGGGPTSGQFGSVATPIYAILGFLNPLK